VPHMNADTTSTASNKLLVTVMTLHINTILNCINTPDTDSAESIATVCLAVLQFKLHRKAKSVTLKNTTHSGCDTHSVRLTQGSYRNLTVVFQTFPGQITSFSGLFKAFCSSLCEQKHYKIGF